MSDRGAVYQEYQRILDAAANGGPTIAEAIVQHGAGVRRALVAAVGPANVGKSTLVNAFASVLAGTIKTVAFASAATNAEGHCTTFPMTYEMLARCAANPPALGPDGEPVFEYDLRDLVGTKTQELLGRSRQEVMASLLGMQGDGEAFPDDFAAIADLLRTPVNPEDAVSAVFILASANDIEEMTRDSEGRLVVPAHVKAQLDDVKRYKPNVGFEHPLLPLLVITKVDEWKPAVGEGPERLLDKSGLLAPLYEKAKEMGFPNNQTAAMGWLDASNVNFSTPTDPRVVVLKHLLLQSTFMSKDFQLTIKSREAKAREIAQREAAEQQRRVAAFLEAFPDVSPTDATDSLRRVWWDVAAAVNDHLTSKSREAEATKQESAEQQRKVATFLDAFPDVQPAEATNALRRAGWDVNTAVNAHLVNGW